MNVNFNNLRKQAAYSYDRLCKTLNSNFQDGEIILTPEEIQDDMDNLRSQIMSICGCYLEGDEDIRDISGEVGEIASFNEETEQD